MPDEKKKWLCQGCGRLFKTKRSRDRHITEGRCKGRASATANPPPAAAGKEPPGAFTKDDLVTGEGSSKPPTKARKKTPKPEAATEIKERYTCGWCGARVEKGMTHCPSCGDELHWEDA